MELTKKNKLFILSIPLAIAIYLFNLFIFKSDNSFVNDIDETILNDSVENNFIELKNNFSLKKFGPQDKNTFNSMKAITRNPFKDLESSLEAGVNLPNNIKFTGIAQVGRKKGVMVSTPLGMDIFYVGQQVSDGFKIILIDIKNAEITLTNGANQTLVKLEQD
tara:strand:+ start:67 stop:555 length:489 start_codon:yes stop_codon:yes gene_type:complete